MKGVGATWSYALLALLGFYVDPSISLSFSYQIRNVGLYQVPSSHAFCIRSRSDCFSRALCEHDGCKLQVTFLRMTSSVEDKQNSVEGEENKNNSESTNEIDGPAIGVPAEEKSTSTSLRERLKSIKGGLTKAIVRQPFIDTSSAFPMPQVIAALIRDAAQVAVESAVEDIIFPAIRERQAARDGKSSPHDDDDDGDDYSEIDLANVAKAAEAAVETSIATQALRAQLAGMEALTSELVQLTSEAEQTAAEAIAAARKAVELAEKHNSMRSKQLLQQR